MKRERLYFGDLQLADRKRQSAARTCPTTHASSGWGLALLTQQPQVRDTVPIRKEHVLAVIPPLRDMVRQPRYDDARLSRHATRILEREKKVYK